MSESTRTLGKDSPVGWYLCYRNDDQEQHLSPAYWNGESLWGLLSSSGGCRAKLIDGAWTVTSGPLYPLDHFEQTPRVKRWMEIEAENERLSLELKKESMAHSATCKSLKSFLDQCTRQEEELAELRQIRERAAYVDSDFRRCGVKASLPIELRQSIEHLCRLYDHPPFVPPPKPALRLWKSTTGAVEWAVDRPPHDYAYCDWHEINEQGQPISSKEQSDA